MRACQNGESGAEQDEDAAPAEWNMTHTMLECYRSASPLWSTRGASAPNRERLIQNGREISPPCWLLSLLGHSFVKALGCDRSLAEPAYTHPRRNMEHLRFHHTIQSSGHRRRLRPE
jgi:hypothetical protein